MPALTGPTRCDLRATVTKRSWTPGRARRKPLKPLRGECRDAPVEPVATTLVWFSHFHARLWVRLAPGIPCSLYSLRGTLSSQNSDAPRREDAQACVNPDGK